jgi:hypothetical protein
MTRPANHEPASAGIPAAPGSPRKRDVVLVLQRIVAVIYFIAGALKPFPDFIAEGVPDNIPVVLKVIAKNNAGTLLEGPSLWFADHPWLVIIVTATAMVGLGIVYWRDEVLVRIGAIGNIVMLLVFITFVHRTWVQLIPGDSLMIIITILILRRANARARDGAHLQNR